MPKGICGASGRGARCHVEEHGKLRAGCHVRNARGTAVDDDSTNGAVVEDDSTVGAAVVDGCDVKASA